MRTKLDWTAKADKARIIADRLAERDALVARFDTLTGKEIEHLMFLEAFGAGGIVPMLKTEEQKRRWIDIRRAAR
jgi:hypothetical protein